jgi:oligoendopeptidase F
MSSDKLNSIPQRKDIEEKYKWDLRDLFQTEEEWEANYSKGKAFIENTSEFTGKLAGSAELLYKCLKARSDLNVIVENLHQYAKRNQDLDHRVSKYQMLTERAAMLAAEAGAAFSFVEPELLQIDDDTLRAMAGQFPETGIYDFYIEELIRSRKHIRSSEIEELLAQSSMVSRGPYNIFTMLNDADMTYPSIKDEKGNEVQLTKQRFAKFMDSSDQRVRKDAHEGIYSTYKNNVNTLSAALGSTINKDLFYSRARRYESCLHHALDAGNIPVSVYHSLLDTTEADLAAMHKWIGLRKKILKLDKIYPYDVSCPLFPEENYDVPYEEAVEEVMQTVKPLGEKYSIELRKAFENRWVDVYETEGKASGAYSAPNYSTHPIVLMNYNDTIDNMFTLAHEMGHCMHSHFSNQAQSYPKSHYSIFVAEVASTLNEGLMLQYLLTKVDDSRKRLFLLNRHIDNTFGTFFHQVLYGRFELDIHTLVEKGQALAPEQMCEMWHKLTKKYYGSEITMDDFSKYKWARIPHFYYTYYVYQYATSYAASQAILDKFISSEEGIVDKYLKLISSGGNDYPINQLKKCGVDMTTADPVKATLKLFASQVDEVEKLTENS